MLGAIIGDIIGSAYEFDKTKRYDLELFQRRTSFTDDTVLTVAVADCILHGGDYTIAYQKYGRRFPHAGWGGMFRQWIHTDNPVPYYSYGNGSAMRVSPAGFAYETIEEVIDEAKRTAEVTHNHPEGIKGAQSVAAAIYLARHGNTKDQIRALLEERFEYNLQRTLDEIRPVYHFDETCQGSVPEAIIAFLESTDYEDAVRKSVSLGGDADTMVCITGGIAEAFYQDIPVDIATRAKVYLPPDFVTIIEEFYSRFNLVLPW